MILCLYKKTLTKTRGQNRQKKLPTTSTTEKKIKSPKLKAQKKMSKSVGKKPTTSTTTEKKIKTPKSTKIKSTITTRKRKSMPTTSDEKTDSGYVYTPSMQVS